MNVAFRLLVQMVDPRQWTRRHVAGAVSVGLALLFAYDLVYLERQDSAEMDLSPCCGTLWATATLKRVHFDADQRAIIGDLALDVFSKEDFEFKGSISVSVRQVFPRHDSRRIPFIDNCTLVVSGDDYDDLAPHKSRASYACLAVVFSEGVTTQEVWYPFDRYEAPLRFELCINTKEACWSESEHKAAIIRVRAEPERTHLVARLSDSTATTADITLERRLFLRMVSVVFLAMAVAFVVYLVIATDPKDTMTKSMGVFGALWALRSVIVPPSVNAFPTIIDGSVLVLFCVVFALVLVRATEGKEPSYDIE